MNIRNKSFTIFSIIMLLLFSVCSVVVALRASTINNVTKTDDFTEDTTDYNKLPEGIETKNRTTYKAAVGKSILECGANFSVATPKSPPPYKFEEVKTDKDFALPLDQYEA